MTDEQQAAFEYEGDHFPIAFGTGAKDILLIDRITHMTLDEFQDSMEQGLRGSVLLGLIATSIRAKYPDWSIERIYSMVMNIDLANLESIGGSDAGPPADGVQTTPEDDSSTSPSEESSSSSTPPDGSSSETSAATPL